MLVFTSVYVSTAVGTWTSDDLTALLAQSGTKNHSLGVTGLLLHRDGTFMQVLEGDEDVVRPLYRTIAHDPRHADVVNVWVSHSPARRFPGWSMGFRDLTHDPVDVPGFVDVFDAPEPSDLLHRRTAVADFLSSFEPLD